MALPKLATKTYQTTLPHLQRTVEFRPYVVREERALLMANQDDDESAMLMATINLVDACVLTEGINANKLADVDLQWLFIQIRSKSVGEDVNFIQKCDNEGCGNEFEVKFNVENISAKASNPELHNLVYVVNKDTESQIIIEFGLPTAETYISSSKIEDPVNQTFHMIESCVQKITYEGNTYVTGVDFVQSEVSDFLGQLPAYHLEKIYAQVFETAPKIYHEFSITCPKCKKEQNYSVEGLPNFFG